MLKKSTASPSYQSGATMLEVTVGIIIVCVLLGTTLFYANRVQHQIKFDKTMSALYILQNEVRKNLRARGSYAEKGMMPLLYATRSFPDQLHVNYEEKIVLTPLRYLLDVTGRGRHFSLDLYSMSPSDCYMLGEEVIRGDYFYLGAEGDDMILMKIGETLFDDKNPPTSETLEKACTESKYVDVFLAFR